jgi:uncharacterized protein (DUF433 family)
MTDTGELITCKSEVCNGKPYVAGTQVSVQVILEYMADHMSEEAILAHFPDLRSKHIPAILKYAAKNLRESKRSEPVKTRILPDGHDWKMQYHRMMRGRERIKKAYPSMHEYYDAIYHFFQDVLHLRDWLCNDTNLGDEQIRERFNKSQWLMIARDVAEGTKHLRLSTPKAQAKISEAELLLGFGYTTHHHHIVYGQGPEEEKESISFEDLVCHVIREWQTILSEYNLMVVDPSDCLPTPHPFTEIEATVSIEGGRISIG